MSQVSWRQDLPPKGGYQPIPYLRVPAKTFLGSKSLYAGFLFVTCGGLYLSKLNQRHVNKEKIEARSAKFAMYPLLMAEQDREFLKQIRRNREAEEKLMADVKGWEVGSFHGEPIFRTVPNDQFVEPTFEEYYIHGHPSDYMTHRNFLFNF